MKKLVIALSMVALLAVGAVAFAHGPGWGGSGMGPGYGDCYGAGQCGGPGGFDQTFFEETADLRKELHTKKFAYGEAVRNPKTDPETVRKLEKEITELQDKIREKAPRTAYGRRGGGYGCRW